jgi:AbrB family looped-hinge helix DNA binding protein
LITNIDDNGRIQLPLAIRYGLHLMPGDLIAVDHLGDGTIILKKIIETCRISEEIGGGERHRQQAKQGRPSQAEEYSRPYPISALPR